MQHFSRNLEFLVFHDCGKRVVDLCCFGLDFGRTRAWILIELDHSTEF